MIGNGGSGDGGGRRLAMAMAMTWTETLQQDDRDFITLSREMMEQEKEYK